MVVRTSVSVQWRRRRHMKGDCVIRDEDFELHEIEPNPTLFVARFLDQRNALNPGPSTLRPSRKL
jgi:hypothetical protein